MTTVSVSHIQDYPALLMRWDAQPSDEDIRRAYQDIKTNLDAATTRMYVIVDLTADPRMPLLPTLNGALHGPYQHPRLIKWLVAGNHSLGRIVARLLAGATGEQHVVWFNTTDNALDYVNQQIAAGSESAIE